jgi:hypothetical protein
MPKAQTETQRTVIEAILRGLAPLRAEPPEVAAARQAVYAARDAFEDARHALEVAEAELRVAEAQHRVDLAERAHRQRDAAA